MGYGNINLAPDTTVNLLSNRVDVKEAVETSVVPHAVGGVALDRDEIPLSRSIIMVSGRAGFELNGKGVKERAGWSRNWVRPGVRG